MSRWAPPWLCAVLVTVAGCEPALLVERFTATLVEVERCTARGHAEPLCQEPDQVRSTIPVVVERDPQGRAQIFFTDAETGEDRAMEGTDLRGELRFQRRQVREDAAGGCRLDQARDLVLQRLDDGFEGAERRVDTESAGCNTEAVQIELAVEIHWRGVTEP